MLTVGQVKLMIQSSGNVVGYESRVEDELHEENKIWQL